MRSISQAVAFGFAILVAASPVHPALAAECANPNALGVSRTVEIDTKGGPGFGFEHYKAYDFLQPKEVVLTFDDGPQKYTTEMVLAALAEQCTKATFFSIGKMALGYPEIIREVAKAGHTIGTHTWSHQPIGKFKNFEDGKSEIERGISGVKRAVGGPIAPFFRFPTLVDTQEAVAYLGTRNIAMFSTDIDSFDFKPQSAEHVVKSVMEKLEKRGKGIVLMHDIHKTTAKALPMLLAELKAKGYKIVHLRAKDEVKTIALYDEAIEKEAKGLPAIGAERPTTSIVRTIEGTPPPEEAQKTEPAPPAPEKAKPAPPSEPAAKPAPKAEAPNEADQRAQSAIVTSPPPAPATDEGAGQETTASIKTAEKVDVFPPPAPEQHEASADAAKAPSKSLSERAKEIWDLWFGK